MEALGIKEKDIPGSINELVGNGTIESRRVAALSLIDGLVSENQSSLHLFWVMLIKSRQYERMLTLKIRRN